MECIQCSHVFTVIEISPIAFDLNIDCNGKCSICINKAIKEMTMKSKLIKPKVDKPAIGYCYTCKDSKPKVYSKPGNNNTSIYVDNSNRQWHGRSCPDCHLKRKNEEYRKKSILETAKSCLWCKIDFTPNTVFQKYCSSLCCNRSKYKPKYRKPRKIKIEYSLVYFKQCVNCNSMFTTKMTNRRSIMSLPEMSIFRYIFLASSGIRLYLLGYLD
jgi:hypothetical protein